MSIEFYVDSFFSFSILKILLYYILACILSFFFKKLINLLFLFLAVLGLCCCAQAFSSCDERGLLFVVVRGLLIGWFLLLQSTGSRRAGFSSCGAQATELWHTGSRAQAQ